MRTKATLVLAVLGLLLAVPAAAGADPSARALHSYGEMVDYPMIFPVADGAAYTHLWGDWFYAARPDGDHHAQDIMAPKMTPVVAPVAGTIGYVNWSRTPGDTNPDRCCSLTLDHDDGWESWYIHLNNDTPGTDDGLGWGIAPGISQGVHVEAGQLLGWVGDSGNAEETGPHLHFELRDPEGTIVNPYEALLAATHVTLGEEPEPEPQAEVACQGRPADIVGTDEADTLTGTEGDDVIHGRGGDDVIDGRGGNDVICGGPGDDEIYGGDGDDRIKGHAGADTVDGGPGDDVVKGNRDADHLFGGDGSDRIFGGDGFDRIRPGAGDDQVFGGAGNDRLFGASGTNVLRGGKGKDIADYSADSRGVIVDLEGGSARGDGIDTLSAVERVFGSAHDDVLTGDALDNVLKGRAGDDILSGADGDDRLVGGFGDDTLLGGDGTDWCRGNLKIGCEA